MLICPRPPARFRRDGRGSAAVEFALLLPVMLAGWAGMSELSRAIEEGNKLTLLARTVSDLTSQGDTTNPVDASVMQNFLDAAPKVMRPFDTANVTIKVSAMGFDTTKFGLSPRVCSSYANGKASPRPVGAATDLTLPPGYPINGARYVLTEVTVAYTPMIGAAVLKYFTGLDTIAMSASVPWPTRGGKIYNGNAYTEVVLPGPGSDPRPCESAFRVDGTRS